MLYAPRRMVKTEFLQKDIKPLATTFGIQEISVSQIQSSRVITTQ